MNPFKWNKCIPSRIGLFVITIFAMVFAATMAQAQTAGVVNLSVTPTTACSEKCSPTVTWSTTPVAQSCTATGGWSGNKAASGTQAMTQITATTVYTLECAWQGPSDPVTVSWIAPTQNTDNSPLTNLAGFKVLYGTSATALNSTQAAPGATTTSSVVSSLVAGTWFFTVRAVNAAGAESDNGNVVSRVVSAPLLTASASKTVTVTPKPMPPTNIQATVAVAINVPLDSLDGFKRTPVFSITSTGPGVLMGFAKIASPSVQDNLFTYRGQAYCKPLLAHPVTGAANVAWIKGVTPTDAVCAPCA